MKVLVTGASGFIGKNFLLSAPKEWETIAIYNKSQDFLSFLEANSLKHITPLQADLSSARETEKLLKYSSEFDVCVFLASNGNPAVSIARPAFDLRSNTATLLNLLTNISFNKFIYFSSGAVYIGLKGAVSPKSGICPTLPYAISKMASEHYLRHFEEKGRIKDLIVVRFFGAYGPYEPSRKIYSMLVRQFGIEKDPHFTIRGDGKNLIDAMYIDDAIHAMHCLIKSKPINATIDLYSGCPSTLIQLVETAARVFDLKAKISYEGAAPEYIEFFSHDKFMLRNFGFTASVPLEKGLLRLYDYLKK